MKKLLIFFIALGVMVNFAIAGDDVSPSVKQGDKALLFSLGGLSNLTAGNYLGGAGFKYYLADDMALRLGLGFGTSTVTKKDDTTPAGPDEETTDLIFSLSPGFTYNIAKSGSIVGYVGAQLSFAMTSEEITNPGHFANVTVKRSGTAIGMSGLVGVEWFPWNNISFSAEYHLGFSTSSGKVEVTSGGTTVSQDLPSTTSIGIGSASGANLTLSVYW